MAPSDEPAAVIPAARFTARVELDAEASAAASARKFVGATLAAWGVNVPGWAVELVTSELVANGVTHAAGAGPVVGLLVTWDGRRVRLEVRDGDRASVPSLRALRVMDTTGRGLHIVSCLCDAWDYFLEDDGKCVWCEMTAADLDSRSIDFAALSGFYGTPGR